MSILSDRTIKKLCRPYAKTKRAAMIAPFTPHQCRYNDNGLPVISYGLSSYGYDVRLARNVLIASNAAGVVVDPMASNLSCFVEAEIYTSDGGLAYFILPPNGYALGSTMENFNIPRNISATCVGKSTYARSFVQINTTPIEAGFNGEVVIEIANGSSLPVKVYVEAGIAQFQFFKGDKPCEVSYGDGYRKYQNQRGITLARI